jgi:hypothetical protein
MKTISHVYIWLLVNGVRNGCHMDIRYKFIKYWVEQGFIVVNYINSENQEADLFTKPLPLISFSKLKNKIGIIGINQLYSCYCTTILLIFVTFIWVLMSISWLVLKLSMEWRIEEGCCKIAILSFHKNYSFYVTRKPHVDYIVEYLYMVMPTSA